MRSAEVVALALIRQDVGNDKQVTFGEVYYRILPVYVVDSTADGNMFYGRALR